MKKVNLLLSAVAIVALSFTSCKNCYDCSDCFTEEELEFIDAEACYDDVEDDDYSRSDFKDDIKELEDEFDCNCK